jgi:chromosomal replication initiator protein
MLYTQDVRALQLALNEARVRILDLERKLACATGERPHALNIRALRIADAVAGIYSMSRDELLGRGRSKSLAEPRQVLYYVCRTVPRPQWSYPEIGLALAGRDHTTIMSGIRNIEKSLPRDPRLQHCVLRATAAARGAEGQSP